MNKKQKGFSLIELLLVLGIIAALAIVAFMVFPKVSSTHKAQAEISNLNTIKSEINTVYSSLPDYKGLDLNTAISAKIFPENMITKNNVITNSFSGSVDVFSSALGGYDGEYSGFTIVYNNVPSAECSKIIASVFYNFYDISINDVLVKSGEKDYEFNIKSIVSECQKNNKAVLTFISN